MKRHYNPSILKEADPHEGMDEIALRELIYTLRTRLAEVEADAAVMRGELENVVNSAVHPDKALRSVMVPLDPIRKALSTNAGKSLLERLKEAERLLGEIDDHVSWIAYQASEDWIARRDALLNPTNKDVM